MRRQGGEAAARARGRPVTAAIAAAGTAPLLEAPELRAPWRGQLVLGETAAVLEAQGDWRRLRTHGDQCEGWVHQGYLRLVTDGEAEGWRSRAAWSDGALVQTGTERRWVPLRARVVLADGEVELPDGTTGRVVHGRVRPVARAQAEARQLPPEEWARAAFAGAPYLQGGVTPHGVDGPGLVQTTWLARGVTLPRDADGQARLGTSVEFAAMRAGDLMAFRGDTGDAVSHVAIAGPDSTLVHATVAAGGVAVQSWLPGQPARPLLELLVAVRRLDGLEGAPPA